MNYKRYKTRYGELYRPTFSGLGDFGDETGEIRVITEGSDAQLLTIVTDSPDWGGFPCRNTENRAVTSGLQVANDFERTQNSRVLTKADANYLEKMKGEAKVALDAYKDSVDDAKKKWLRLAEKYQKIAVDCSNGSLEYDTSGTGWALAVHPTGVPWGGGAAADCTLTETGKLQGTERVHALSAVDAIGPLRRKAFKLCDLLMVNAIKKTDAQNICNEKQRAIVQSRIAFGKMGEASMKMDEIRTSAFDALDKSLGDLQSFFEKFLEMMEALIAIIKALADIVQKFLVIGADVAAKFASFFIKHPNFILVAGGAIALGVLAFVLRPYITIISAVFRK